MTTLTTLSAAYAALKHSETNRRAIPTIATLDCGAQIVAALPRLNDTTRRLKVGFRKDKFSALIHWVGTASAYASDEATTFEQIKYAVQAAEELAAK